MQTIQVKRVTDYPMDADDKRAYGEYADAMARGDREAAHRALCKVKISPPALLVMLRTSGADAIRKDGYNTILADKEFGPGWLDRNDIVWEYL